MVNYPHKDLFLRGDVDKQIRIAFSDGVITNKEMHQGSFELTESICSDQSLLFGSCESSVLQFKVHNVLTPLVGQKLLVSEILNGNIDEPFYYGKYKVLSDKPTADRKYRDVVAYDAMYDILNAEVSKWYNDFFKSKVPETEEEVVVYYLKEMRDSFFEYFGIEQEEITLINDDMVVKKTVEPEQLSGKTVINAICEINGCFGHIGRNGKFQYISLKPIDEGLYPSETLYPSEDLYPAEPNTYRIDNASYISAQYEDYLVEKITQIQIRQEDNDIGGIVGEEGNAYIIQGNFLVYGKSTSQLQEIGQKILDKISGIYYRPFNAKLQGNPCIEVGDAITINTKYQGITSYVLQRTLTGIQSSRDNYVADGTQYQPTKVNGIHEQITQLRGKTNKLTVTVDETKSEISDLEKRTETQFIQTDEEITALATRTSQNEKDITLVTATANGLDVTVKNLQGEIEKVDGRVTANETSIKVNSNEISSVVKRTDENEKNITAVTQTANGLAVDVADIDGRVIANSSSIAVNSNAISAEVTRAKDAEAQLKITADGLGVSITNVSKNLEDNYYTIAQSDSKIAASASNILLSVEQKYETISDADKEYERLQGQISVNAGNIALKVSSSEVQNMINLSIEGATITANQIKLEGYTTINGGFSVDSSGNATLSNGSYSAYLSGSGFVISGNGGSVFITPLGIEVSSLNTSVISCDSITIGGNTPLVEGDLNYIEKRISAAEDLLSIQYDSSGGYTGYSVSIIADSVSDIESRLIVIENNYVTSSALSSYVTESELTSVLSQYATVEGMKQYVGSSLGGPLSRISSLESRVTALEAAL